MEIRSLPFHPGVSPLQRDPPVPSADEPPAATGDIEHRQTPLAERVLHGEVLPGVLDHQQRNAAYARFTAAHASPSDPDHQPTPFNYTRALLAYARVGADAEPKHRLDTFV